MGTLEDFTLTADGTVQDVIRGSNKAISKKRIEGCIDLANMVLNDVVVITFKRKIKSGGTLRRKWQVTYTGVQTDPDLGFAPHFVPYGVEITLQQTAQGAGGYKTFDVYFEKY